MKTRNRVVRVSYLKQDLRKEYLLWGIVVWYKILDTEDLPSFVPISCGCFGDTSG